MGLSETLHHEFAMMAPQVKVSVLCPGWVRTNIADSVRNRPAHLQPDEPVEAGAALLSWLLDHADSWLAE